MVIFLQRTFTSLVNAHVGRTQNAALEFCYAVAPQNQVSSVVMTKE